MLFDTYQLGRLTLANRAVMAPMTRSRAVQANTANALMAEYYGQRASAGLIITEATSVSANGLGYVRIPGLFNEQHQAGWRLTTDAIHQAGGKVFVQLFHMGRVNNLLNLPAGARVLGPSAETCPGEIWTDSAGLQPHTAPTPMVDADISQVVAEFAHAAQLAMAAGFDGIEIHAANGYLLEQFLNANVNRREDGYGGSALGRNRLLLEVVAACGQAIGADRVGVRVSPFGVFNSTGPFDGMEAQYLELAAQLAAQGIAYLHLVDHSAMGAPPVPAEFQARLRQAFGGCFMAVGGFDLARAEQVLQAGEADLIAFGRPFIANPDLLARLQAGAELNQPNPETFYTADAVGYTDYPRLG